MAEPKKRIKDAGDKLPLPAEGTAICSSPSAQIEASLKKQNSDFFSSLLDDEGQGG